MRQANKQESDLGCSHLAHPSATSSLTIVHVWQCHCPQGAASVLLQCVHANVSGRLKPYAVVSFTVFAELIEDTLMRCPMSLRPPENLDLATDVLAPHFSQVSLGSSEGLSSPVVIGLCCVCEKREGGQIAIAARAMHVQECQDM